VVALVMFVRRRVLSAHGGVFDCGMRVWKADQPCGWSVGMARYQGEMLTWYRAFSFMPTPAASIPREDIKVAGHRAADDVEAVTLFMDHVIVALAQHGGQPRRDLSMTQDSLIALLSWLEAAPPGGATYGEMRY
jgi:hypothetical protein